MWRVLILRRVQDQNIAINDLDFPGNVDGSKWVITSDHDNPVRALIQHADGLLRIILERAAEDQETSKSKIALDLLAAKVIDLLDAHLAVGSHLLVAQREDTGSHASEVLEGVLVVVRHMREHFADRLGGTLDSDESGFLTAGDHDCGDGGLALKRGRELETTLDLNNTRGDGKTLAGNLRGCLGCESIAGTESPSESLKGGLLHGISDDLALVELDKGVGGGKDKGGL